MAIRVGTSWTLIMIAQLDYGRVNTYARIREQDQTNNKTKYSLKTVYELSTSYISIDSSTATLDGSSRSYGYTTWYRSNNDKEENILISLEDRELTHETDGTSPIKNVGVSWSATFGGSFSSSVDIDFPKIKRQAIMASANDFNDEQNPSMSYIYYEGVDFQVNAYLEVNGTRFKTVEDIGNVGTYTFELTSSERNQLRQLCTGQSMTIRYGVATLINSQIENAWDYRDRTMTIVNAEPTFTYSVVETNSNVINMLGGSGASSIVKNASNLQFSVVPTSYKYASILNVSITDGVQNIQDDTSPYSLNIPIRASKDFIIKVKDSRQYETTQSDTSRTLLDYLAVSINSYSFKRQNPTSSNVIFNGDFIYWGNIGSYTNTPVVKYKLGEGSWNTIPSSNYTIDSTNHKLTISNYTISNILSYQTQGQFSISIEDILTSQEDTSDKGKVLKGIPTFDAGEHDLKVNGDLYIADTTGSNAINVKEEIEKAGGITYSTSEVKTNNKWIDNKPIYRKVVNFGNLPNQTQASVNHNISNVDRFTKIYGIGYSGSDYFPIPFVPNNNMFNNASISLRANTTVVRIATYGDLRNYTAYVILEYTKTTD